MQGETAVTVRLGEDALDQLDAYRRSHKSPPSRAGAVKELLCLGLDQHDLLARHTDQIDADEAAGQ